MLFFILRLSRNYVNQKLRLHVKTTREAFDTLVARGLGKLTTIKQEKQKSIHFFQKVAFSKIDKSMALSDELYKMDITKADYKKLLIEPLNDSRNTSNLVNESNKKSKLNL